MTPSRAPGQRGQSGQLPQPPQRSQPGTVRRGRRPAGEDTRTEILDAARAEFAAKGYDASSLRAIARLAEVDPALVHHYFEGKAALFVEAMSFPVNPRLVIDAILAGPREQVGERLAATFFDIWDSPDGRERLVALIRSAVSHEDAARMLREFLAREVFGRVASSMDVPQPHLRAGMAAAQMIGLAMMRYVVGFEPVVRASTAEIVALVAPTLQRYLADPHPGDMGQASLVVEPWME
ncbi:MAG: TetR family transcriptional regulator [Dermatophilaceae bacterium]